MGMQGIVGPVFRIVFTVRPAGAPVGLSLFVLVVLTTRQPVKKRTMKRPMDPKRASVVVVVVVKRIKKNSVVVKNPQDSPSTVDPRACHPKRVRTSICVSSVSMHVH